MFDCKVEESADNKILTINGELTIQNIAELWKILIKSLKDTAHLALNLENITEIDMSFLQLLCSAHKTTIKSDKHFTLHCSSPEIFREAVKDSGYQQIKGCELVTDNSCLWVEGNDG